LEKKTLLTIFNSDLNKKFVLKIFLFKKKGLLL
jgi:hypothetical protein